MRLIPVVKKRLLLMVAITTIIIIYQERELFFAFHYPKVTFVLFVVVFILTLVATKIIFLRIAREYEKNNYLSLSSSYLQVFVFALLALLINIPFFFTDWPKIHIGLFASSTGLIFIFVGMLITLGSMKIFGSWRKVIGSKTNKLDTTRFYKYSRNPQLLGYGTFLLGFTFLWPSIFAIVCYFVYWYISFKMILVEESHLKKTFGEDYFNYCVKTPRLL